MGRLYALIVSLLAILALFQNCGDGFQSADSILASTELTESIDINEDENNIVSKSYDVMIWQDQVPVQVFFTKAPSSASLDQSLNLNLQTPSQTQPFANLADNSFNDYINNFYPKVFEVTANSSLDTQMFMVSDDGSKILALAVSTASLSLLWEMDLPQVVSQQEFIDSRLETQGALKNIVMGSIEIQDIAASSPNIVVLPTCAIDEHIEQGQCVSNTKNCAVSNGTGNQTWNGSSFGACTVSSCNPGYQVSGNSCVIACNANEHLSNGQCVSNTQTCPIANGTGTQTWNGSSFGTCQVSSCNPGYIVSGNACVSSCQPGEQLINGQCYADTQSCPIANGTGMQALVGTSYGPCSVVSCNSGYMISGNSCITACSANEHLSNGQCVSNTQTCPIANGMGTQTWNGSSFDVCTLNSCNSGYSQNGNQCVETTIACNIADGTGTQTWNGTSYNACTLNSCNAGYSQNGNQCVETTIACNIADGTGTQTWNGTSYNTCTVSSCNSGYTQNGNQCDPVVSQRPPAMRIAASYGSVHTSCSINSNDVLRCWGQGSFNTFGDGTSGGAHGSRKLSTVLNVGTAKQITTGLAFSCAVDSQDRVWCWGALNARGELGRGVDGGNTKIPALVKNLGPVKQVDSGHQHSCAIDMQDQVWCWGWNKKDQLGATTTLLDYRGYRYSNVPLKVVKLAGAKHVIANLNYSCAIDLQDRVQCWGDKYLMFPTRPDPKVPVVIPGLSDIKQLSGGRGQICALNSQGQVLCFGYDYVTATTIVVPKIVPNLSGVKQISSKGFHACAIDSNDELWCWGMNDEAQLGNNSKTNSTVPVKVHGIGKVKQVSTNETNTCAVDFQDRVWCWGSISTSLVPKIIPGL